MKSNRIPKSNIAYTSEYLIGSMLDMCITRQEEEEEKKKRRGRKKKNQKSKTNLGLSYNSKPQA